MSETLLQYLREARATETGLSQTLELHIATTPFGEHRERLERHLAETRTHERRLARRLDELEPRDLDDPASQLLSLVAAPVGLGLGIARGAARAMLAVVGLSLSLIREPEARGADRVLRNVRVEAASEALEIATYTAIERIAAAEGDEETAGLAAEIRAEEEEMLEYLRGAVVELSDVVAGGPQTADRRPQSSELEPEPVPVAGDGAPRRSPVTSHQPPEPPHVSEEPELVAEAAEPGAEEPAGAEVEVEEPWDGYDRLKAAEIERRLEDAGDELVAVVRLYEASAKNRQTVIRAADRRLRVLSDLPRKRR